MKGILKPSFIIDNAVPKERSIRAVVSQYGNLLWIEPSHSKTRAEAKQKAIAKIQELEAR